MSSLLDLGPLTEEVTIRGVTLTIRGLTAANLFKMFSQFPDIQKVMSEASSTNDALRKLAPDLIAKIIAAATGSEGDRQVEEKASQLGAADQMEILAAVQRLSFPQGFVPFVNQMTRLLGTDTTTRSGSSPRPVNSSRGPSSAELQTDSPGMMRGTSPRAS